MKKKSVNKILSITLKLLTVIFLFFSNAQAQTPPIVYVASDGSGDFNCNGNSDQVEINQALNYVAANSGFTTVYLKGSNTFVIDEPVLISSNTILTGDSTSVIKLKDNAGWWTYDKPMIAQTGRVGWDPYGDTSESITNVEIYGFTIDGGMLQLEPSGNRYNTLIHFTFPNNVKIHHMHFENGRWDAIRLSGLGFFQINSEVYNNNIFSCGHDGISFVGVVGCNAHHNKIIKTRTNSGIRASHSDSIYFHHNVIGNSISLPPSGYAGIQIQNSDVDYPCTYADIYENVIYGKTEGIHLGEETSQVTYPTGTMKGVHIHHNRIYKTNTITTQGTNITLTGGIVVLGFQNTLIEHNVVDGSISDGIVFRGNTGGGSGYQTVVRNNIIINNKEFGISNESPSINTFISNNNLVYNNESGNYQNTTSTNDVNSDPMFGTSHSVLNKWNHIVATYDNATETMKIYIDGAEKSSASLTGVFGAVGSNSYNLILGAIYNLNYWFEGKQDEFALWNKALTPNEISSLYNNGSPLNITGGLTNDLQAYFKMENNWNDASGNGFNAQDSSAGFTTNAIAGNYAGSFNGIDEGVLYPDSISTTNGITISVWTYRTGLTEEIQTIVNKGRMNDFDHFWLYFRGESVMFEIGNGTIRTGLEAYITNLEDLDYHVKSTEGRWNGSAWVNDTQTSPCVDGGFAQSDFSNEPTPNGGIVNIGLYGNTSQASKSNLLSVIKDYRGNETVIFPNPTNGRMSVSDNLKNGKYEVFSITGAVLKQGVIENGVLDFSEFSTGIYFLKIIENNTGMVFNEKILKQ